MSASNNARRRDPQARHQTGATMQGAFLAALARRVAANPSGWITLPTGPARASEIRQVLAALDRAAEDR